ncbi:MAG: VOC family protein [Nocardioidaceae bacterium]
MSTRDEPWSTGTPCWVDLLVDDTAKATEFYEALFGWDCQEGGPEAAGYLMCMLSGRPTAGIGQRPEAIDMPSVWTTYLATDDAEQTARRVIEEGGSLMMEPFDVLDVGRMAVGFDPAGSAFGLWQAKAHRGAGIVNEAGALTWNECMTRDYEGSKAFYGRVFGHEFEDMGDDSFRYAQILVDGRVVGGLGELSAEMPAEIPSHWMTYIATDDTDATVEQAISLGAVLRTGPMDTAYGRMAVLEGPQGEVFSVIKGSHRSQNDSNSA